MKKTVLMVLLILNVLMELGGAGVMLLSPASFVPSMLHMALSADVVRAVAIVGGSTLAFAVVAGASVISLWRNRDEGYTLALVHGLMLLVVGAIMGATGTAVGFIDAAKGLVLTVAAVWARPSTGG
jgi:hypothetical protein